MTTTKLLTRTEQTTLRLARLVLANDNLDKDTDPYLMAKEVVERHEAAEKEMARRLPEFPMGYRSSLDQYMRIVAGAPIDAIAVRAVETGKYMSVEMIPFDCAFEEMDPSDWSRCEDALFAPADLVLLVIDANNLNTTANRLREAIRNALDALEKASSASDGAVDASDILNDALEVDDA